MIYHAAPKQSCNYLISIISVLVSMFWYFPALVYSSNRSWHFEFHELFAFSVLYSTVTSKSQPLLRVLAARDKPHENPRDSPTLSKQRHKLVPLIPSNLKFKEICKCNCKELVKT